MSAGASAAGAAAIALVCGSSGSGKSLWVKQQIAQLPRVLVYDTDDEYSELPGFERVTRARDLAHRLRRARAGRYAFVPASPCNVALFEFWSKAAFAWGTCAAVAEELADVTSPGKAPPGWGMLIRRGRKRGIHLYAVTQRPSESDKTAIGNATLLHCGALARRLDRAYMAAELDAPESAVAALAPLDYIERDRQTGALTSGRLYL